MGFLSNFDKSLAFGGISELDPAKQTISGIPNALLMDPLSIPAAGVLSGNLGPFGTPVSDTPGKGTDNPLAVKGITDVASDKGAEIAALIAAGSYFGAGGGGGWFGGESGGAGGGGTFVGDIPVDPSAGSYLGEGSAYVGDLPLDTGSDPILLADSGTTATDVSPGLVGGGGQGGSDLPLAAEPAGSTPATGTTAKPPAAGSSSWANAAKRYGIPLGLLGVSAAIGGQKQQMPNQAQYQQLSAEAQALATQLIEQYRSGTLSGAQQAQLDQLTQNTKNQINSYYASIGQSGSTSHQQALAKADQDALALKANMLQSSLQQGLQAIGVAQGPLNTMANYQLQQDKKLQDAYANFARSAATLYGYNSAVEAGK